MQSLVCLLYFAPSSALFSTAGSGWWTTHLCVLPHLPSTSALLLLHGPNFAILFWLCLLLFALSLVCFFITNRNLDRASEANRRSQVRFFAAADSTLDAFFILEAIRPAADPAGPIEDFVFTYLNHNAEKLLLKPRHQVLGERLTHILPLKSTGRLLEDYRQVVRTGQSLTHEFPLHPEDLHGPWMRHHVAKLDDGLAITASEIVQLDNVTLPPEPTPPASPDHLRHVDSASHRDALTGLPSRTLVYDRIQLAMARANRYSTKVAVLLVNLDAFRVINDTFGHIVGDQVLIQTATRLRNAVRGTDSVLRLGGDEFIIVLPDIAFVSDIRRTAATIVAVLQPPILVDEKSIQTSCTIGVAIYPDSALTIEELLHQADLAMCQAKLQGKNKYQVFHLTARNQAQEQAPEPDHAHAHLQDSEQQYTE